MKVWLIIMWKLIHNIDKELFSKLILRPTGKVYFLINEIKCEQGTGRVLFKIYKNIKKCCSKSSVSKCIWELCDSLNQHG